MYKLLTMHIMGNICQQLRNRREELKLSATVVAEAAEISRVTLYRIEKGEPSVAMGAYTVLQSLNADLLTQNHCLFGGGTAIVLARDEYRESIDIDFLVSDPSGYQKLRSLLTQNGINAITRNGMSLTATRDIRADQYGLRTMLLVGEAEFKFEIVREARIDLEKPIESEKICSIPTLTALDMATTKLLANSDRWSDDSVYSRDLLDLAMVGLSKPTLQKAIQKASVASLTANHPTKAGQKGSDARRRTSAETKACPRHVAVKEEARQRSR